MVTVPIFCVDWLIFYYLCVDWLVWFFYRFLWLRLLSLCWLVDILISLCWLAGLFIGYYGYGGDQRSSRNASYNAGGGGSGGYRPDDSMRYVRVQAGVVLSYHAVLHSGEGYSFIWSRGGFILVCRLLYFLTLFIRPNFTSMWQLWDGIWLESQSGVCFLLLWYAYLKSGTHHIILVII